MGSRRRNDARRPRYSPLGPSSGATSLTRGLRVDEATSVAVPPHTALQRAVRSPVKAVLGLVEAGRAWGLSSDSAGVTCGDSRATLSARVACPGLRAGE